MKFLHELVPMGDNKFFDNITNHKVVITQLYRKNDLLYMKEFFPFDVVLKFEMKLLNFVLLVVGELIILDCKSFFRLYSKVTQGISDIIAHFVSNGSSSNLSIPSLILLSPFPHIFLYNTE